MHRLGWLTLTLFFVSGSVQAAPQFRFRAKPHAVAYAKTNTYRAKINKCRATTRKFRATTKRFRAKANAVHGGAFHRASTSHLRRVARGLSKPQIKIKATRRRGPADSLNALDPRLAALTRTLIKAEGRAKQIDKAPTRRASATNRIDPGQGAEYQKAVGGYRPLSPKQFAATLRDKGVPRSIAKHIALVDVKYRGYDGKTYQGQIVVHKELRRSIARVFHRILTETDFPIRSVIPVSDKRFGWSDRSSVAKNNSSGFNFRLVSGSLEVSDHAFGTAVDINPEINPWVKAGTKNRNYNPSVKGTLDRFSKVVKIFKQEGWKWGGDWKHSKDWQHFYRADIPERDFGKREVPE